MRHGSVWALAWMAALLPSPATWSQTAPAVDPTSPQTGTAAPSGTAAERERRERELRALDDRSQVSDGSRRRLADEIAALKSDGARLAAALVAAAQSTRAAEERISAIEARLSGFAAREIVLDRQLAERREALGQVLAALQRLQLHPPPAFLARPDDILAAIRGGMLLGGLTPALRADAERVAADLAELAQLRGASVAERDRLAAEAAELARERTRLAALIDARRDRMASAEAELRDEKGRADTIARTARTVRDLIARLDGELDRAARDGDEARRAAEARAQQLRERFASAAGRDPLKLGPTVPFASLKGQLARPAAGAVLRAFGVPDGVGGTTRGISIATRPRALVTAPADASVAFAGPFRSFGRLLILNAGDGYYVLMAGLDGINVEAGQFVLAGEPVGQMGDTASLSAATPTVEASGPVLYVEFRRDGGSIDPGPWWAKSLGEKVRG